MVPTSFEPNPLEVGHLKAESRRRLGLSVVVRHTASSLLVKARITHYIRGALLGGFAYNGREPTSILWDLELVLEWILQWLDGSPVKIGEIGGLPNLSW